MQYRILAVGDVVGKPGLDIIARRLRELKRKENADFCIVNGENAAMTGISPRQADAVLDAGADVITLGNHTFGCREICNYLDDNPYILRPANFSPSLPGRGRGRFPIGRDELAVVNLSGRLDMKCGPESPFSAIENILPECGDVPVIVDFHAEATSEKLALGFFLDGKASAVFGTHTHVPTADARVLPQGTGFVTDLGMTGPWVSVLGVKPAQSVSMFRGELTSRFEAAEGACAIQAVCFTVDFASKKCLAAERCDLYE